MPGKKSKRSVGEIKKMVLHLQDASKSPIR